MRMVGLLAALGVVMTSAALARTEGPPDAPGDVPAQIKAVRFTTLSSELAGKIRQVAVKEGERFSKGDTLVAFACDVERAQLGEARALLKAATNASAAQQRLLELNSAGTLEVQQAKADVAVARAKVDVAGAVVSKCAVSAPYDGRVAARAVQDHQYVQAGQALLEILDDTALEAEFIVPSTWIPHLSVGRAVGIRVAETGRSYPAAITRLGAKVDPVSHSVKVTAGFTETAPDLMAGMTGTAVLAPDR